MVEERSEAGSLSQSSGYGDRGPGEASTQRMLVGPTGRREVQARLGIKQRKRQSTSQDRTLGSVTVSVRFLNEPDLRHVAPASGRSLKLAKPRGYSFAAATSGHTVA